MNWIGPAAKKGATYAVKYGPQAKMAWDRGGKQAQQAATRAAMAQLARRRAFQKAGTVTAGAVLRVVDRGEPVYVVFSGEEPIETYPPSETDLETLLANADRSKVTTFEEYDLRRVANRVRRARRRTKRLPGPRE